jgi:hypothetical protein
MSAAKEPSVDSQRTTAGPAASAAVTKQRHAVEVAQRTSSALRLATDTAQAGLAERMREHADT